MQIAFPEPSKSPTKKRRRGSQDFAQSSQESTCEKPDESCDSLANLAAHLPHCRELCAFGLRHIEDLGIASDVADDGITANAVLTWANEYTGDCASIGRAKPATWEQQASKRLGESEDVTGSVLFLTSGDAAFITGQAIVVDGGHIASPRSLKREAELEAPNHRRKTIV
jgi:hypothetical protein